MTLVPDSGPCNTPTSKDGAGFRARRATGYRGTTGTEQELDLALPGTPAAALVGRRIETGDVLRTYLHPELEEQHTWSATYVGIDLETTDGTRLSATRPRDQYGQPADPRGQGAAKILFADQWNDVQIDLAGLAGRTISRVLLRIDAPTPEGQGPIALAGYVDGPYLTRPELPPLTDPVAWVDTRRGTNASGDFSRGNTLPITAWPNGFAFYTPLTDAITNRWPYQYQRANDGQNRPRLQGLGVSHQPSPWMGDRNQLVLMPSSAATAPGEASARSLAFDRDQETARPDRYGVRLEDGTEVLLVPTDHGAAVRVRFSPQAAGRHLVLDTVDENARFTREGSRIEGWVDNGPEDEGRTRMYLAAVLGPAPISWGRPEGGHEAARCASFAADEVEVRLATSFVSTQQARANLDLELTGRSLEDLRAAAHTAWSERLGVITVDDQATAPQRRTLYGNLYRLNLYPNSQWENAGTAQDPRPIHASPVLPVIGDASDDATNAQIRPGRIYVNNGFWDTYRTAWPAYALLYPRVCAELVDGFVQQYREGGWIARWSSPGYADLMTGTSSDVAFADAHLRGIELPDPLATYEAGLRNATVAPEHPAVGRKGVDSGMFTGYVDTDTEESVSWALEGHLNDFGLAAMAADLAEDPATPEDRRRSLREEATYLLRRSLGYAHLFDPAVDFFQGRRPDGAFATAPEDFDPCSWGGDFTETDGWNFAFHVAHDGGGLAALYGGRDGLRAKLDAFFSTPEHGDRTGSYGGVIHEMIEARDVRMGQFGFSNQPAHHIPFQYNHAGAPHRTQEITREVHRRLFTGEQIGQGYPGDEDNGEMSAWWILTALGLYPLRMGAPEWALTAPLFSRADVRPLGGMPFTVTAAGQAPEHCYIQDVSIDGRRHDVPSLPHAALRRGGELSFVLGDSPSSWGATAPDSLTPPDQRPQPWTDLLLSAGEDRATLVDDDSRTAVVLDPEEGQILLELRAESDRPVQMLTLTSAAEDGADPEDWQLEARGEDGRWQVVARRQGERFGRRRRTRPFALESPTAAEQWRLRIASATPVRLAQVELLG